MAHIWRTEGRVGGAEAAGSSQREAGGALAVQLSMYGRSKGQGHAHREPRAGGEEQGLGKQADHGVRTVKAWQQAYHGGQARGVWGMQMENGGLGEASTPRTEGRRRWVGAVS